MLMAVGLHCCQDESSKPTLAVFAGYESGQVALFTANTLSKTWNLVYICKPHAQPVLSISSVPSQSVFLTSGADAVIARHPLPSTAHTHLDTTTPEILQTKHAGQQSITARSDGKIFATAGWDGRARVYSAGSKGKGMRELAVLKWHREGCYAVAFAEILDGVAEAVVSGKDGEVVKRELTVAERRVQRASQGHWLAVGSKDGKVSLWEIY